MKRRDAFLDRLLFNLTKAGPKKHLCVSFNFFSRGCKILKNTVNRLYFSCLILILRNSKTDRQINERSSTVESVRFRWLIRGSALLDQRLPEGSDFRWSGGGASLNIDLTL